MFLGGLIDLGLPVDYLKSEVSRLKIPFQLDTQTVLKKSIRAIQVHIVDPEENHHHHHRPAAELVRVVQESDLSDPIKKKSISIIGKIARAEGKIHGQKPEEVYLHEIGGVDTLVDIAGVLIGLDYFHIDKIKASSIPTGYGSVLTSHGELPIPAPATIELLRGVPVTGGQVPDELTTPTGAAIISTITEEFGAIPSMIVEGIGYGAGYRDYEKPNVLRLLLGRHSFSLLEEDNILIETNLDDMSPQIAEYVSEKLFEAGALDVYTTPIYMKKHRPAFKLSVLVAYDNLNQVRNLLFQETTTLGLREIAVKKAFLSREDRIVETIWGKTTVKISYHQNGFKVTPEYEECKIIARNSQVPLIEVIRSVQNTGIQSISPSEVGPKTMNNNQDSPQ